MVIDLAATGQNGQKGEAMGKKASQWANRPASGHMGQSGRHLRDSSAVYKRQIDHQHTKANRKRQKLAFYLATSVDNFLTTEAVGPMICVT